MNIQNCRCFADEQTLINTSLRCKHKHQIVSVMVNGDGLRVLIQRSQFRVPGIEGVGSE